MLGACAHYQPAPLDPRPHLVADERALVGAERGGVSLAQLDALVLRNSPELVAARAKVGVAQAQMIQARILPNPQFAASYPFYISGFGGSDGFGLSLAQDVRSLILRPTRREIAANALEGVRASLLWQEWLVISKARLLFVQITYGDKLVAALTRAQALLDTRFKVTKALIDKGAGPLAALSPDLVATSDMQKVINDSARLQLSRRHQLNALLGLKPDATLHLVGGGTLPALDAARVRGDLASLADRRPDLVALQYGYRSKDAELRQAILSQYPNLVVGILGGRDTSDVFSVGPQAAVDLPVFNRNEGNIAAADATRAELGREFEARVTATTGEVEALLSEQALQHRQLAALAPRLAEARAIAKKTELAFAQGNFDERSYVDIEVSQLTQEQQKLALEQSLAEQQVTLASLIGAGLPHISIEPEPPPADPLGLLRAASR